MFSVANDYKKKNKLPIKFDSTILNMIIGYLFKSSVQVTRRSLKNLKDLFDIIDDSIYVNDEKMYTRIEFIKKVLDARIVKGFENEDAILNYCISDNPSDELKAIVNALPQYKRINYEEIKYINKCVQDRLTFSFILKHKDNMYETIEKIDSGDFRSYQDICEQFSAQCSTFLNEARKIKNVQNVRSISLMDEDFDAKILDTVSTLKNPSRCFKTGIKALNKLLSPGYESGRCYYYCGTPGGFKSGLLLKSAVDIKKYNKGIKVKKPGKIPAVLYITLENSVAETVERLFNMTTVADNIRQFTPKQVLKMLKEDGQMSLKGTDDIDIIIKYYGNMEIDTQDLYTIIEELEDDNREVICLIVDYLKRIRSAMPAKDEKEMLKNVTNEFANLAKDLDIPVISAHQVNREGARTIDAAMENNKTDVGRLLGRGNVGSAFEVLENADWFCFINKEIKRGTNRVYLSFKRAKIRGREDGLLGYFNHPFVENNGMQLMDDIYLDESLSEESLSSDFDGVIEFSGKKGKRKAVEREIIDNDDEEINQLFDMNKMVS